MKKIIINIGRQFGAGGLSVARMLGEKLSLPVYHSELISKAAKESGFSCDILKGCDERRSRFSMHYRMEADVFNIQSETSRKIASEGSAIILGRCSDYILRDLDCTLNVFLTSPVNIRAERVSRRDGIPVEEALEIVEEKDKKRKEYYDYFTFGEWGVASTYDLCVDSSILGIEATADFIIDFAKKSGLL